MVASTKPCITVSSASCEKGAKKANKGLFSKIKKSENYFNYGILHGVHALVTQDLIVFCPYQKKSAFAHLKFNKERAIITKEEVYIVATPAKGMIQT